MARFMPQNSFQRGKILLWTLVAAKNWLVDCSGFLLKLSKLIRPFEGQVWIEWNRTELDTGIRLPLYFYQVTFRVY